MAMEHSAVYHCLPHRPAVDVVQRSVGRHPLHVVDLGPVAGIEPATCNLEGSRSSPLSYTGEFGGPPGTRILLSRLKGGCFKPSKLAAHKLCAVCSRANRGTCGSHDRSGRMAVAFARLSLSRAVLAHMTGFEPVTSPPWERSTVELHATLRRPCLVGRQRIELCSEG